MKHTRKQVIEIATNGGHTVAKAIEIALAYERGDEFASRWIEAMQSDQWPLRPVSA